MSFKDILAVVTSAKSEAHVIAAAEQLAVQTHGRLSALVTGWLPPVVLSVEGWTVSPMWAEAVEEARRQLASEHGRVKARMASFERTGDIQSELMELASGRAVTGMWARHADVTVVGRPQNEIGDAVVEGPLFESGRPVLVTPPGWTPQPIGRSVLVCWKPTREAARALGDAADLISQAAQVTVVTVDAQPSEDGYGPRPGLDITAHLARRGASANLANLTSMGRSEASVILEQAVVVGADLIVMGGYGRSRMSQFIFGGVTRDMLKSASMPVLMSH
jgi:nucleotide-binding universal stress UspA family protein